MRTLTRENRHSLFLFAVLFLSAASFALLPWIGYRYLLYSLLVYFLTACIGGTITYHRLLSHHAFAAPAWFKYFGLACGTWGLYGSPIAWAAVHREHHVHQDTPDDPHSPLFKPWWEVQFLSSAAPANLRLVPDLLRDPALVFVHRHYFKIHFVILLTLAAVKPAAILYLYLWPAFLTWNLASLVNTLGHQIGYRNFATRDNSRNLWPLGILVFGEGWHNNHHARPGRYSFAHRWWELDIGALVIRHLIRPRVLAGKKATTPVPSA